MLLRHSLIACCDILNQLSAVSDPRDYGRNFRVGKNESQRRYRHRCLFIGDELDLLQQGCPFADDFRRPAAADSRKSTLTVVFTGEPSGI
ncbi:hypothetical protein D3C79_1027700 [compost metagenome]